MRDVEDGQLLAEYTKRRRTELGLTMLDVAKAGGPSDTTLSRIENAEIKAVRTATFRKLDQGLSWPPGTASAIYAGRPPHTDQPNKVDSSRDITTYMQFDVAELGEIADRVDRAANGEGSITDAAAEFKEYFHRATADGLTRYLEDHGGPDSPRDQIVVLAFGQWLETRDSPSEDQLYRRWLAGYLPSSAIDEHLLRKFQVRLNQARSHRSPT